MVATKYAVSSNPVKPSPVEDRRAFQVFARARCQLWRYAAAAGETRKKFIVRRRLAHLCYVLAQFDRSGDCREIYAAMDSRTGIYMRLVEFESGLPEGERLRWSRATVYRHLARLRAAGIEAVGAKPYHGRARRRLLVPHALLTRPPRVEHASQSESCTANLRQVEPRICDTRSQNLKPQPPTRLGHDSSPAQNACDLMTTPSNLLDLVAKWDRFFSCETQPTQQVEQVEPPQVEQQCPPVKSSKPSELLNLFARDYGHRKADALLGWILTRKMSSFERLPVRNARAYYRTALYNCQFESRKRQRLMLHENFSFEGILKRLGQWR